MTNQPQQIICPSCGSNQVTANKRGFSAGKAIVGGLATGGIGLLAGLHGSRRIEITCLNCGHVFKAGDTAKIKAKQNYEDWKANITEKKKAELHEQQVHTAWGLACCVGATALMVVHWVFIPILGGIALVATIIDLRKVKEKQRNDIKLEDIERPVYLNIFRGGIAAAVPVALFIKAVMHALS